MTHSQKTKAKIALVGSSLGGGGAERIHAILSKSLVEKGFGVDNVLMFSQVDYEFSGSVFNADWPSAENVFQKFSRIFRIRRHLKNTKPDFIVDFRYRDGSLFETLLFHLAYNAPVIYTVHSGKIENYIGHRNFVRKMVYDKAFRIIGVSKKIADKLREKVSAPVIHLYNPVETDAISAQSDAFVPEETRYILAIGRLNERVKQFDKLIPAFAASGLKEKNVKLLILGDGPLLPELETIIAAHDLAGSVVLKGHQPNPFPYFKNALFTVLCSQYEGFPNVLVESLALGTPVVAFDCFSGPSEIIKPQENGLLVADQDFAALSQAMQLMATDETLRNHCAASAKASVSRFDVSEIVEEWVKLF